VQRELDRFESFPFDFALPDLNGQTTTLSDYSGRIVLVDVWGTWCPPCMAAIPDLVKLQANYEQDLSVVGINIENAGDLATAQDIVRQVVRDKSINYTCLIGNQELIAGIPEFVGFPTTLFVDRTGKVRLKLTGKESYGRLERIVQTLLAEAGNKS
jgi:thiol-disulfide isomerase/thioredoxin